MFTPEQVHDTVLSQGRCCCCCVSLSLPERSSVGTVGVRQNRFISISRFGTVSLCATKASIARSLISNQSSSVEQEDTCTYTVTGLGYLFNTKMTHWLTVPNLEMLINLKLSVSHQSCQLTISPVNRVKHNSSDIDPWQNCIIFLFWSKHVDNLCSNVIGYYVWCFMM